MSNNNNNSSSKNRTEAKLSDTSKYSPKQFADLFYKCNKDSYIVSSVAGWYSYNEYNVMIHHPKEKEPLNLNNKVMLYLTDYIQFELKNMNVFEDDGKKAFDELFTKHQQVSDPDYITKVIKVLKGLYLDDSIDEKIDTKPELFAFKNKVFDVKEGIYRDIERKDYILKTTGYDAPDSITDYKLVDDLIYSIFEDKEVCDYYLMTTAMSIFTNRFEKIYILTGNGRNGKGVLSNLVDKALGNYYLQGANDLLTTKDESKNETLAQSVGIRYLAISEPAEDNDKETKFNISVVKKLTGRDKIVTRALYKNAFTFIPRFTIFVSCNKQPAVDETNEAIRNRFRFIHFPFTFVDNPSKKHERKLDVNLKDELDNDTLYRDTMISYLLHLVSQNYDSQKIKEPAKCTEFTKSYFDANDDINNFLEKYFDLTGNEKDRIRPTDIYQMYCEDGDYKKVSTVKFADGLKSCNIEKHKISGSLYYFGLKKKPLQLNNDDSESDDDNERANVGPKKNALDL
jgi:P4 family phage/plasmid primase-like protien